MRLWLTRNTDVPMREQLVTQITIGIATGELSAGDKLPSRDEISRRFKIHANTVSNAYQELAELGLAEFRQGSGFFVSKLEESGLNISISQLVNEFFQAAESLGYSRDKAAAAIAGSSKSESNGTIFVVEPDREFREILVSEIRSGTGANVFGISLDDLRDEYSGVNANFVALADERTNIDPLLTAGTSCKYLRPSSVAESLATETRPDVHSLIAIVSGWEKFIKVAKTFLLAARIEPESIVVRSTKERGWQRGLESMDIVIVDSLTAQELPHTDRLRVFRIMSDESLNDVKKLVKTEID